MRLNKFIAHNSKYSRREADRLILEGKVKINKVLVTDPSIKVEAGDKVSVNNQPIKIKRGYTVIVYNKPKGELVTKKDPLNRKTIYHSLPSRFKHFLPVGRLDFASEGLLLLSDSAEVVDKLMNSDLPRVYRIKIKGFITEDIIHAMKEGIVINGNEGGHKLSKMDKIEIKPFNNFQIIKNSTYSILKVSISEGQNRELRRFFAHFNKEVLELKRYSYGWISLNYLKTGKWRYLNNDEYKLLHQFLKQYKKA